MVIRNRFIKSNNLRLPEMAAFFNSLHFNCIDGKQVETPIPAFPQGGSKTSRGLSPPLGRCHAVAEGVLSYQQLFITFVKTGFIRTNQILWF
jgi:hypothetical protein